MTIDYVADFPMAADLLPPRLLSLLEPVGTAPNQAIKIASRYDHDQHGLAREYVHMLMAVVPENSPEVTPLLNESSTGVVSSSVPVADHKGDLENYAPSVSQFDYMVASRGDGSFYTFNLAEKVWMALGLTPRAIGNDQQRIVYDDLALPEFGVAGGEVSSEYYWTASRDVSWTMSNEYLRKYLWMRGMFGVRVFFYEALVDDAPSIRAIMNGQKHIALKPNDGWYELDIREHKNKLLVQLWASVKAVSPELCPERSADGVMWPNVDGPMSHARANALVEVDPVYLDDKFLQRYEQNAFYDTTPVRVFYRWHASPSYRGQWAFTDCVRVGRNLVRVPMRELYKPKPDREILHAREFAKSAAEIANLDLSEEHIVGKVERLLAEILNLGDNVSALGAVVGLNKSAIELTGLSRAEVAANGWLHYPQLRRLAQVAPLEMNQQAFLSRCKSLHEIWQKLPDGFLKSLLERAGCAHADVKGLGSLKLLQGLLNIVEKLNADMESADAFENHAEPEGWRARNKTMAALFLNNDLRIADAHEAIGECLQTLQDLGFDTANVNQGYGRALDFVVDGVINSLRTVNEAVSGLLQR